MGSKEKACIDTLTADEMVLISKTRFLNKDLSCPQWRLGAVIGVHSLDLELSLTPDQMRELAGFLTKGAQWLDDQLAYEKGKIPASAPPSTPKASTPLVKGRHLRLLE